jgi:hypothetical protein
MRHNTDIVTQVELAFQRVIYDAASTIGQKCVNETTRPWMTVETTPEPWTPDSSTQAMEPLTNRRAP